MWGGLMAGVGASQFLSGLKGQEAGSDPGIGEWGLGQLKDIISGAGKGVATGIGGSIGSKISRVMGESEEDNASRLMERLYPKTNPWERIGAAGAGAGAIASAQRKKAASDRANVNQQMRVQKENIQKDRDVARIKGTADILSSVGVQNPKLVPAYLKALTGGIPDVSGQRGFLQAREDEVSAQWKRTEAEVQRVNQELKQIDINRDVAAIGGLRLKMESVIGHFNSVSQRLHAIGIGGFAGMSQKALADISGKFGFTQEFAGKEGYMHPHQPLERGTHEMLKAFEPIFTGNKLNVDTINNMNKAVDKVDQMLKKYESTQKWMNPKRKRKKNLRWEQRK